MVQHFNIVKKKSCKIGSINANSKSEAMLKIKKYSKYKGATLQKYVPIKKRR